MKRILLMVMVLLTSCTSVQLVSDYDKDLLNNTEDFYKKAAEIIDRGITVSPHCKKGFKYENESCKKVGNFNVCDEKKAKDTCKTIHRSVCVVVNNTTTCNCDKGYKLNDNKCESKSNFLSFKNDYNRLLNIIDALIMRSMINGNELSPKVKKFHKKINNLIDSKIPECEKLQKEFQDVTLTTANYIDLKCKILKWKEKHRDDDILTKASWEGRKLHLFETILMIQTSEKFKKK